MSKLDDIMAVIFGSAGGNTFAYDEEEIPFLVKRYEDLGQTAYVLRKSTPFTHLAGLLEQNKDSVNELLENMSRDDVWYIRERAEELYSAAGYAFEQKED
jgi:hypothetical protein